MTIAGGYWGNCSGNGADGVDSNMVITQGVGMMVAGEGEAGKETNDEQGAMIV